MHTAENAYPPPRDQRLSRKTRAAVGKPPGTANAVSAVSTADNPDAGAVPIGHWEAAATIAAAVANHKKLAQHRPVQFPNGCVSPVDDRHRIAPARSRGRHRRAHLLKPGSRKAWRYSSRIGHDRCPTYPSKNLRQPRRLGRFATAKRHRRQAACRGGKRMTSAQNGSGVPGPL